MPITQEAWAAWEQVLGPKGILNDRTSVGHYEANAAGWRHRLAGVLQPGCTSEVQAVIKIAGQYGACLQPVSCGCNWGYNSRLPAEEDQGILLDLSRMNRVRNESEISSALPVAEIEPGVTQGQLAELLKRRELPLLFNATGAGPATSLLGNSLERGVGYFGLRTHDISDLEVVLGTGEILRTGSSVLARKAKTRLRYPYGLGPSLDGLFFQSNLGVVTSAAFKLLPRRSCHQTLIAKRRPEKPFAAFVDALSHLRRLGLVQSVLHIGSPNRVRVTLSPLVYRSFVAAGRSESAALRQEVESLVANQFDETWTAVGPVFGTDAQVSAAKEGIEASLADLATVEWITSEDLRASKGLAKSMLEPLVDLCEGIPTQGALDSPHWSLEKPLLKDPSQIDQTDTGVRFCSPALPSDGEIVDWAIRTQQEIYDRRGFEPYLTLNLLDGQSALLITNLIFDKSVEGDVARADLAIRETLEVWAREGIFPYRLGLNEAQAIEIDPVHAACLAGLKRVFDPKGVLGPGRYHIGKKKSNYDNYVE